MLNKASCQLFVPTEKGYTALPPDIAGLSKTHIAHHLNYRPSQLSEYVEDNNKSGILAVVKEAFSLHVFYVRGWAQH